MIKSYQRDKEILLALEKHQALNTDQLKILFFPSLRRTQQRMARLYELKKVKRCRYAINEPYAYYIDKRSGRLEHLLELNWVYVWLIKTLADWQEIWCFEYEDDYKILRCDAFAGILNKFTNVIKFYFIELDRSNNTWDKTLKYNLLYEGKIYKKANWVEYAEVFPTILCVSDKLKRLELINKSVQTENKHNLNFKVMLLQDLKGEVLRC